MEEKNLPSFREFLNRNSSLTEEDMVPKVSIDMQLPLAYIDEDLVTQLELLEPFGKGNQKPVFVEKDLEIINTRILGKNQNVLKMQVRDMTGKIMDALYFGNVSAFLAYFEQKKDAKAAFTYYPTVNEYQGKKSLQIVIQNYR